MRFFPRQAFRSTGRAIVAALPLIPAASGALDLSLPAQPVSPAVPLPEVTVRGKLNAFEQSDRKLRLLIENGPCLGCDNSASPPSPSIAGRVLDTAVQLLSPQENQPVDHDYRVETELGRAEFEKRLPTNRNP